MRRLRPVLAVLAFAAACGDSPSSPPGEEQEAGFIALPIAGELNGDWYVTNYVDGQERSALDDCQCGIKSYPGHLGTDLVLPDGAFGVYTHDFETFYSMSWWWTTFPALDEPGTWSVQIKTHEGLAATMSFNVTMAGAVRMAPDAIMSASGGGIR